MEKIRLHVFELWTVFPFILHSIFRLPASTSSLMYGPSGRNVSNPLAIVHCPVFGCRSRAVTSFAQQ